MNNWKSYFCCYRQKANRLFTSSVQRNISNL